MRIIDADEIKYIDMLFSTGNGNYEHVGMVTQYEIDALPTVDAIPIEYILKQIIKLERSKGQSYHAICYRHLIEAWAEREEE